MTAPRARVTSVAIGGSGSTSLCWVAYGVSRAVSITTSSVASHTVNLVLPSGTA